MTSDTISQLLHQLQDAYALMTKLEDLVINPPATDSMLSDMERQFGFSLAEELVALYRTGNGSMERSATTEPVRRDLLLLTHSFCSIELCLNEYAQLKNIGENENRSDGYFAEKLNSDAYINKHRDGAVKRLAFSPYWVPVGSNYTGTFILVDHDPGPKGNYGQVLFLDVLNELVLVSDSISDYLKFLIRNIKPLLAAEDKFSELIRLATRRTRVDHFIRRH